MRNAKVIVAGSGALVIDSETGRHLFSRSFGLFARQPVDIWHAKLDEQAAKLGYSLTNHQGNKIIL